VASTLNAHFAHLGCCPVVQHEVDVRVADTGSIELDKDFIGLDFRYGNLLDLLFSSVSIYDLVGCEKLRFLIISCVPRP
jgi:hypothetical protein